MFSRKTSVTIDGSYVDKCSSDNDSEEPIPPLLVLVRTRLIQGTRRNGSRFVFVRVDSVLIKYVFCLTERKEERMKVLVCMNTDVKY